MIKKTISFLSNLISYNWGTKIMALFLACLVWIYLNQAYTDKTPHPLKVPIKLDLPANIISCIKDLDNNPLDFLDVELEGPRGILGNLPRLVCKPKINLGNLTGHEKAQTFNVTISESAFDLPPQIRLRNSTPNQIRITLSQGISKHMQLQTTDCLQGNPVKGYRIINVKINPSEILVGGPKDILDKLNAIPISKIDVSEHDAPFSQVGRIQDTLTIEGVISKNAFMVEVDIQPELIEKTIKGKINILRPLNFHHQLTIKPLELDIRLQGPQSSIDLLKERHLNLYIDIGTLYSDPSKEIKPPMTFTLPVKVILTPDAPKDIQVIQPVGQVKLDIIKPAEPENSPKNPE